ncbi:hypothetical protein ScPMuIL_000673 [Solemya velum]
MAVNMWTYALLVCGALLLTDARECSDVTDILTTIDDCYSTLDSEFDDIAHLLGAQSFSQSSLRSLISSICRFSVPLRSCLAERLADCSNYVTEIATLGSTEDLMCNRNGSVPGELNNLIDQFSNIDLSRECRSAVPELLVKCLSHTPEVYGRLTKDIRQILEEKVYGTLTCTAKQIKETDVSVCGKKSDVMTILILYQYFEGAAFLVLPFNYSTYLTTVGSKTENESMLGRVLGL